MDRERHLGPHSDTAEQSVKRPGRHRPIPLLHKDVGKCALFPLRAAQRGPIIQKTWPADIEAGGRTRARQGLTRPSARQWCGSKGAYNRPSYPCHYCTYRGGLLRKDAVDKPKADDQRHAGQRQHHHLKVRKAVGGKHRKIVHDMLPQGLSLSLVGASRRKVQGGGLACALSLQFFAACEPLLRWCVGEMVTGGPPGCGISVRGERVIGTGARRSGRELHGHG